MTRTLDIELQAVVLCTALCGKYRIFHYEYVNVNGMANCVLATADPLTRFFISGDPFMFLLFPRISVC